MERLIKKLSELQGEAYKGAYIGKVVWEKSQPELPAQANARLSIQRASKTFMRIVLVLESCHKAAAQLTVTLFLAAGDGNIAPPATSMPQDVRLGEPLVFTAKEIAEFVRAAGDDNPIHAVKPPVVPGLLILQWLQAKLPAAAGISVRFLQPLYGGETMYLSKMPGVWQAYGRQGVAFQAKIQYFTKEGNKG